MPIAGPTSVVAVAGGQYHSLAVTSTGEVWGWGYNANSQLGDGTNQNRLAPVKIAEAGFGWKAATPTFSLASGTYYTTRSVTIATATVGATIRYTTDGSDPTSGSTLYTTAVPVNASTTIKARAFASGLSDSNIGAAAYTLKVAAPTFSPWGGTYSTAQNVSMSSSLQGVGIR